MVTLGNIQEEDVLLIQAVIRMTAPLKCVEFGYLNGFSAQSMLNVMRPDAKLISYDNSIIGNIQDPRFTFKHKSQTEYEEEGIDFVFFDASHDFELNRETFNKVVGTLNDGAIVAVHDTGLWNEMVLDTGGHWVGGGYAHRVGEREFVNWVSKTHSFKPIHFHSMRELRHGMTLLQKNDKLKI